MKISIYDGSSQQSAERTPNNSLGQQEFLRLLTTELQYQDPLSPMDQKDFITQLAQFSSLEAMNAVRQEMSEQKAVNLMGKRVKVELDTGEVFEGKVDGVELGSENMVVIGDRRYAVSDVTGILAEDDTSTPALRDIKNEIEKLKASQMLNLWTRSPEGTLNRLVGLQLDNLVFTDSSGEEHTLDEIAELIVAEEGDLSADKQDIPK